MAISIQKAILEYEAKVAAQIESAPDAGMRISYETERMVMPDVLRAIDKLRLNEEIDLHSKAHIIAKMGVQIAAQAFALVREKDRVNASRDLRAITHSYVDLVFGTLDKMAAGEKPANLLYVSAKTDD